MQLFAKIAAGIELFANKVAPSDTGRDPGGMRMRLQAIPDHQQRLLQVGFERFEEFDDLCLLDAALVQPEQAVGAGQPGYDRDVVPVEVNWMMGVYPLGAQVRTRVGRSLNPD